MRTKAYPILSIWVLFFLSAFLWSYWMNFRIPEEVEMAASTDERFSVIKTLAVDIVSAEQKYHCFVLLGILATLSILVTKERTIAVVSVLGFCVPTLAVSLALVF
jgi:hypothetical protein